MKNLPAPRFQKVEIEPFTREEVSRMLKACTYSKEADTSTESYGCNGQETGFASHDREQHGLSKRHKDKAIKTSIFLIR
jgi:hypothetical protein